MMKYQTSLPKSHFQFGAFQMKLISLFWAVLMIPVICIAGTVKQQNPIPPFQPGETLTYQLSWEFIPVGTAVLEVLPMTVLNGQPVHHFAVTVKTNAAIDKIYKVRDHIQAYADSNLTRSVLYTKKQQEGKHKRDVKVTFDWNNMTAQYINFGKKRDPIPIRQGTFDPVSLFYAFRSHDLQENSELRAPVTDGKSLIFGTARILAKEKVKVAIGSYETLIVEPDIKDAGGVFEHAEDARLRIWISADSRHIPIRVTCRAPVGHFIGELVSLHIPEIQ